MKLQTIYRFEVGYQVRRPWVWLFVVVLIGLDFLMTRDGSVAEVLYADFYLNSSFSVAKTTVFGSLLWLVLAAAIAGDAAARDVATGMHPLVFTTPISKWEYLGGRFLAALTLNALLLLAVQVGILLGVYLPGVDAQLIGPFRPAAFLSAYGLIALPNAFFATAIQFGLATRSGRAMAGYFGSFLVLFMGFFVASFLLFSRGLGTLLDPIGIRFVVEDIAHLWTPFEKNWRVLALEGIVLQNRLLWLGVGLVAAGLTFLGFRFAHRVERPWLSWFPFRAKAVPAPGPAGSFGLEASPAVSVPQVRRNFNLATGARQVFAVAWDSLVMIASSWAGMAVLVALPLLTVPVVLDQMESNGVPLLPATPLVLAELTGSMGDELSRWVIIPFLIVFFAGELVWRERDARLNEISDALPTAAWVPFVGKFLGLGLVLALLMALLSAAGLLAQTIRGYHDFELGLYGKVMFGLQLPDYLLFALLALVVHVVVDQKYIGHLVATLAFVFIALSSLFGVEHNLLIYGAGPGWSYTEMRGFGASLEPWLWFKLYWAAWALLLAVGARLLWARGRERSLSQRLQLARQRFTPATAWTAAAAAALVLTLGGFIFYNTNVRNPYFTAADRKARGAEYERRYARYAATAQPQLAGTKLRVEIYPDQRTVDIRGIYRLVNRSSVAIDSVHVVNAPGVETTDVAFSRPISGALLDDELAHRIYALRQPLRPGDSLQMEFRVRVAPRGFGENGVDDAVVANGTHFTNAWLPAIGYQSSRELLSASDRREHGLAPRPVIASLYNVAARTKRGGSGGAFEAIVGTAEGQVAVAPGALRRTWAANGRRYFHYGSEKSVGGEWGIFSANYAVREEQWQNPDSAGQVVAIRIFHHPQHTAHLDRLVEGIRASLTYYTKEFGPYRLPRLSVVERPGLGTGMHAETGMIVHGEGFTAWNPGQEPGSHDHPYAIITHEMAHQWTVPYAPVEGAPVMSESVAWYYGLMAVEHSRGPEQLGQLLGYMRQPHPFPAIRRGEPLLRGLDSYLSYRRGPFALYALSQYVGEARVNRALRTMLEKHRSAAPLATTLDLYRELRAATPDSLHYLLRDLFEANTYWEFETKQVSTQQTQAGPWQVTLDVQARKTVVDSAGVEREVPMNDWVEVGVFAPREENEASAPPLYLRQHRLRSGTQQIRVLVPHKPARAGLDPRQLLIDLEPGDNARNITP